MMYLLGLALVGNLQHLRADVGRRSDKLFAAAFFSRHAELVPFLQVLMEGLGEATLAELSRMVSLGPSRAGSQAMAPQGQAQPGRLAMAAMPDLPMASQQVLDSDWMSIF